MKPTEYPTWIYHKEHEPRLLKDESQLADLPGSLDEWSDSPSELGIKLKVTPMEHGNQLIKIDHDAKPDVESDEITPEEQGAETPIVEKNLADMSEDEVRAVLIGHGYPAKKLAKKTKEQMLGMIAK